MYVIGTEDTENERSQTIPVTYNVGISRILGYNDFNNLDIYRFLRVGRT
jgi:hypothetical protein